MEGVTPRRALRRRRPATPARAPPLPRPSRPRPFRLPPLRPRLLRRGSPRARRSAPLPPRPPALRARPPPSPRAPPRRELAALRDHLGLHLDPDVREDVDRDRVAADPLDRIGLDLAPVDPDLLRAPQLVDDVRRRDGAEERAGRARLDLEAEHGLRERLGDRLRLLEGLRLVPRALLVPLVQLGDTPGGRLLGEPPREQEVARVAACHRDDVAA